MDEPTRPTARSLTIFRAVCAHGMEGAARSCCVEVTTVKEHLRTVYAWLGIPGDGSGKIGRACYRLGRIDERRKRKDA